MKRTKTHRPAPSQKASPSGTGRLAEVPTDFRAGLLFVLLFEVGHFITLGVAGQPASRESAPSGWQYAFIACTALMALSLAAIWRLGVGRRRWGWVLVFSVIWFILLTGRIVTFFPIAEHAVPVLLALVVGQISFALILPAVAREQRKAARASAPASGARSS